jgi:predicted anti-sigma-YlaC factor YlaD
VTDHIRPEALYLYLEGELGLCDAEHLEEHLETCPACRDALAERRGLHEAFTSLPPFEVPSGFAASVLERLPEPAVRRTAWLAPLVAAASALGIGLIGFHAFTGTGLVDLLVALNRLVSSVAAEVLPLAVKTFKLFGVLMTVISNLLSVGLQGLATFTRVLGPAGTIAALGLALLVVSLLAYLGTRRFLNQGE